MSDKMGKAEARYSEIERTQEALRTSIEQSKALAADSDRLLARRRDHDGAAAATPDTSAA